jgi:iron complex outermembrane receptor protein
MNARHVHLALLVAFGTLTGYAQTDTSGTDAGRTDSVKTYMIDEVVVTGTRSPKKVLDVPYPVERIPVTAFSYDRKVAVDDALKAIPGLFLQSRYGNHDVRISMRGFGSRSNTGIRGIRILLDGIPESEPDGQTRIEAIDFNSLGAIELMRGNFSSAYTNAPGGVINFINDLYPGPSSVLSFNQFGSFGLSSVGLKTKVNADDYRFLGTYSYHSANGFRPHSFDYWHILNAGVQVNPGGLSTLAVHIYYVDGLIRLPGSLTAEQFDADPFQANPREVGRDARRLTEKGRVGIRYSAFFGGKKEHQVEVTAYGTTKYFERLARTYRIFNRNGFGMSAHYTGRFTLFGISDEFTAGVDAFRQTGPIEEYQNIGGTKGDELEGITNETIGNRGAFLQEILTLAPDRLDLTATVRYDNMSFEAEDRLLGARNSRRTFNRTTPKVAMNFKFTPRMAAYASWGLSFDTPADNEMDNYPTSSNPTVTLNPDLRAQKSRNLELGVKGSAGGPDGGILGPVNFEATLFRIETDDEIVPFEVYGDVFYRNAAKSERNGLETGFSVVCWRDLTLKAAYTWSDFTYSSYVARSTELDTSGNVVDVDRDFTGNTMPSNPEHNFILMATFERKLSGAVTGFFRPSWRYISGLWVDDLNSASTEGYHQVDLVGGFDVVAGKFHFQLSGGCLNVADLTYVSFVNINSAAGEYYEAGAPRNYYAGLNLGYTP